MNQTAFVVIESMNDGDVNHLVGPMTAPEAEDWLALFLKRADYDPEFVYIVHSTHPASQELKEWYEI